MKALIIGDDKRVISDVTFSLRLRYPEIIVLPVAVATKGIGMVETEAPDLVVADSSLPEMNILDLIIEIRRFSDVPLLVLSQAETDIDRAKGLEAGADEYVLKPLSPIELLATVRALLRRTQGTGFKDERLVFLDGQLTIDFISHEVIRSGKQIKLTPTEYNLLSELVRNEGRVLTHQTLLQKVWGAEYTTDYGFIKKYISRLRSKLEADASKPKMLRIERGVGYKFIRPT